MFWALGSKFVSTRQPHVKRHETKNLSRSGEQSLHAGTSLFQAIGLTACHSAAITVSFLVASCLRNEKIRHELPDCGEKSFHSVTSQFYAVNDIAHVIIGHIRAGRKAETHLEKSFFHTVGVDRSTGIDRLLVHRLPRRTGLDLLAEHEDAQGLDIRIRLTVSRDAIHLMNHTGGATHSILDHLRHQAIG